MIEHINILCPCPETMLYYSLYQQGICICSKLGENIPSDVWLDQYFLPFLNECSKSSKLLDSQIKHCIRITSHNGNQVIFCPYGRGRPKFIILSDTYSCSSCEACTCRSFEEVSSFHAWILIICPILSE